MHSAPIGSPDSPAWTGAGQLNSASPAHAPVTPATQPLLTAGTRHAGAVPVQQQGHVSRGQAAIIAPTVQPNYHWQPSVSAPQTIVLHRPGWGPNPFDFSESVAHGEGNTLWEQQTLLEKGNPVRSEHLTEHREEKKRRTKQAPELKTGSDVQPKDRSGVKRRVSAPVTAVGYDDDSDSARHPGAESAPGPGWKQGSTAPAVKAKGNDIIKPSLRIAEPRSDRPQHWLRARGEQPWRAAPPEMQKQFLQALTGEAALLNNIFHTGKEEGWRIDPNATLASGETPLTLAARKDWQEKAAILVAMGANPDLADAAGSSPLLAAVQHENDKLIECLVALGAHPDLSAQGMTPVMHAATRGAQACVGALLRKGATLVLRDSDVQNPLYAAAKNGHAGVLREIFKWATKNKVLDSRVRLSAQIAVIVAVQAGKPDLIPVFVEHGISLEFDKNNWPRISPDSDKRNWRSALTLACELGANEAVQILLEHRADINRRDRDGVTPLITAVRHRRKKTVKLLLERGANPVVVDDYGHTARQYAQELASKEMVALLDKYSVDHV
ncbi:MAG: ankyrin repeat protein 17-like isoform [Paucimonas sp.]|nr:ankyrin repeat protein 17-like isoform [Paucimonas sp.]